MTELHYTKKHDTTNLTIISILLLTLLSIGSPLFLRAQKIIQVGNLYQLVDEKKGVLLQDCDKIVSHKDKFFFFSKNGENSVLNITNSEVYLVDYDSITAYDPFINIFFVEKNYKQGVYTVSNKKILPPIFDEIYNNKNYLFVQKDSLYGLYSAEGKEIIPIKYNDLIEINPWKDFKYAKVQFQNKFGIIDYKGKEIIPPLYEDIRYWEKAGGFLVTKDSLIGLINTKGKINLPPKYKYVNNSDLQWNTMLEASTNGKTWGSINKVGKEIIPFIYERVQCNFGYRSNKLALVQLNEKWGLTNYRGKEIAPIKYTSIDYPPLLEDSRIYIVETQNKYGVVDLKGKGIISPIYKEITALSDADVALEEVTSGSNMVIICIDENDKMGFIQNKGQIIIPPVYDSLRYYLNFEDGMVSEDINSAIICYKGNKVDLFNFLEPKRINAESFDSIVWHNYSGVLVAAKNNQYQFVDLKKGVVLSKTFDKVKVINPYFIVTKNQKLGIVGMTGEEEIAPLIYDEISFDEDKKEFVAKIGSTEKRIEYKLKTKKFEDGGDE